MFVQALAAYADKNLKKELNDVAFEERAVPYFLQIGMDGSFLGAIPRFEQVASANGKGKPKQRSQTYRIPRTPVKRNAGLHPLLCADDIKYVLGVGSWTALSEVENHRERHEAFVALIAHVASELNDDALVACQHFYAKSEEVDKARTALGSAVAGSNVALYVSGGVVIDREPLQNWWRKAYQIAASECESGTVECLISGVLGPVPSTHNPIKNTSSIGGQSSGISLMSFDKAAFRSYGWKQNANSPVSADRAMAYVLALNDLLKPGSPHRKDFDDVAFLFWLRSDSPLNPSELLDEAPTYARIAEVKALLDLSQSADPDPNYFYMAGVSANGSRLILRSWIAELLPDAVKNVLDWWEDLQMQPLGANELSTPRFVQLIKAIKRQDPDKPYALILPSPGRIVDLRRRALEGPRSPLGYRFVADVLQRMRVDSTKRTDLASLGLLRLCLNDLYRSTGVGETMPPSLDPHPLNTHPASYLCGQLLAIHDYLQWKTFETAGESQPNSTVADRFYTLVMTSPAIGMEKVFTLGRKHIAKLRKLKDAGASAAFGIEQQIAQVELLLGGDIPPRFGMHDKARFALGFYHQKAYRPKKAGSSETSTDNDTPPTPDEQTEEKVSDQ